MFKSIIFSPSSLSANDFSSYFTEKHEGSHPDVGHRPAPVPLTLLPPSSPGRPGPPLPLRARPLPRARGHPSSVSPLPLGWVIAIRVQYAVASPIYKKEGKPSLDPHPCLALPRPSAPHLRRTPRGPAIGLPHLPLRRNGPSRGSW